MDRAVLDAYGWTDVPTDCEFLLDYEDDEEESSRRKKPWRYRWPDEVRDEVLARLLELNAKRAAAEERSGAAAAAKGKRTKRAHGRGGAGGGPLLMAVDEATFDASRGARAARRGARARPRRPVARPRARRGDAPSPRRARRTGT